MSEREKQIEGCCIIDELTEGKPFSSQTYSEKQDVLGVDRPCSPLTELKITYKVKQKEVTQIFSVSHHQSVRWLGSCKKMSKLFSSRAAAIKNTWIGKGFSDLNQLFAALQQHEKSVVYMTGTLNLEMFSNQRINLDLNA